MVESAPATNVSTTSAYIRKVLVGLTFSALPVASSINGDSANMVFVIGSVFATSAGAVLSGGQSPYFNSVPLPLTSAGMVKLGWINIPNSFAASAGISTSMLINDWRETQGIHLSSIQGTIFQP